jgi:hypothetical protein
MRVEILAAAAAPLVMLAAHFIGYVESTPREAELRCERLAGEGRLACLREVRKAHPCESFAGVEGALCLKEDGTVKAGAP